MEKVAFHPDFIGRVQNDAFLPKSLLEALDEQGPVSVRLNPKKTSGVLPVEKEVSWCENAVYLSDRPSFTLDPLFHAGGYYPQEAGSMVLDKILRQLTLPEAPKLLDLCAAPGGKSTLMLSLLNNEGMLVSNEVINARARILKENCTKWGFSNSIVTNNDPSDFQRLPSFFDVMVVDAPCSGEGMFRKDTNARSEWSQENVNLCAARQKRIVADAWDTLTPGGYLIYSTCTFNASENEESVQWLCDEFGATLLNVEMPESFQMGRNGIGHYAFPGTTESEGFFIAVLKKQGEGEEESRKKRKGKTLERCTDLSVFEAFVNVSGLEIFKWKEYFLAVPETLSDAFLRVYQEMHIVKFGTELGAEARKGLIPSHDLAMNFSLRKAENTVQLSEEEALHYLRGETFSVEKGNGFRLVTYENEPLGWVKNIGVRFNNHYPKEWRIKMRIN